MDSVFTNPESKKSGTWYSPDYFMKKNKYRVGIPYQVDVPAGKTGIAPAGGSFKEENPEDNKEVKKMTRSEKLMKAIREDATNYNPRVTKRLLEKEKFPLTEDNMSTEDMIKVIMKKHDNFRIYSKNERTFDKLYSELDRSCENVDDALRKLSQERLNYWFLIFKRL